ncbi:MAG TPA: transketolase C-terminal domain-containing protein, partial [Myxococcota bacterium]|nr:transketolase C-terminal domain-containing protein [Myxococcota bacterium]
FACMAEVPCVIVNVMRGGPSTGAPTSPAQADILQSRWGTHGDHPIIVTCPTTVQEIFLEVIRAFNLAERYRTPVFVLADEGVGHLRETVVLHRDFELVARVRGNDQPPFGHPDPDGVPPMPIFGDGANLMVTGSTHDAWGFRKVDDAEPHDLLVRRINRKILDHAEDICEVDGRFLDDAEVALVAYGFSGRSALAAVKALRRAGVKVGLLRLKTLWPFPARQVAELGKAVRRLVVPEMNLGQVGGVVRQHVRCDVELLGQVNGEVIEPEAIERKVREVLP